MQVLGPVGDGHIDVQVVGVGRRARDHHVGLHVREPRARPRGVLESELEAVVDVGHGRHVEGGNQLVGAHVPVADAVEEHWGVVSAAGTDRQSGGVGRREPAKARDGDLGLANHIEGVVGRQRHGDEVGGARQGGALLNRPRNPLGGADLEGTLNAGVERDVGQVDGAASVTRGAASGAQHLAKQARELAGDRHRGGAAHPVGVDDLELDRVVGVLGHVLHLDAELPVGGVSARERGHVELGVGTRLGHRDHAHGVRAGEARERHDHGATLVDVNIGLHRHSDGVVVARHVCALEDGHAGRQHEVGRISAGAVGDLDVLACHEGKLAHVQGSRTALVPAIPGDADIARTGNLQHRGVDRGRRRISAGILDTRDRHHHGRSSLVGSGVRHGERKHVGLGGLEGVGLRSREGHAHGGRVRLHPRAVGHARAENAPARVDVYGKPGGAVEGVGHAADGDPGHAVQVDHKLGLERDGDGVDGARVGVGLAGKSGEDRLAHGELGVVDTARGGRVRVVGLEVTARNHLLAEGPRGHAGHHVGHALEGKRERGEGRRNLLLPGVPDDD
mmetsp:Transcript_6051/g.14536  ORF Transcript_6051/g.14536 Transcript_6051/m.14536 type:complete len:562 (-) Transcript_6051:210-1895(-)